MSLAKVKLRSVRAVGDIFELGEGFLYPGKAPDDVKMLLYEALYPCGEAELLLSVVELDHFLVTLEHITLERQRTGTGTGYGYNCAAVEVKVDGRHLI